MTDLTAAERRETVPVSLGDRSYDIHIGEGILARAGDIDHLGGGLDLIAALSVVNILLIGAGVALALRLGVRFNA